MARTKRQTKRKTKRKTKSNLYSQYKVARPHSGNPSGIPVRRRVILRWCKMGRMTALLGDTQPFINDGFSLMNPYDPDTTVGIGQKSVMGLDLYRGLYDHMVVLGAKITARFSQDNPRSPSANWIAGMFANDQPASPYNTAEGFIESKKGKICHIDTLASKPSYCNTYYSTKKFFNVSDVNDNYQRFGRFTQDGTPIGSRSEDTYLILWATTQNPENITPNQQLSLAYELTIDYVVEFSEPNSLQRAN